MSIHCDDCDEVRPTRLADMPDDGWRSENGIDYCPACTSKRAEPKPAKPYTPPIVSRGIAVYHTPRPGSESLVVDCGADSVARIVAARLNATIDAAKAQGVAEFVAGLPKTHFVNGRPQPGNFEHEMAILDAVAAAQRGETRQAC